MAVEIFVGMYLLRILSIGPVGFILAFLVSVLQSIVDLFPTPEQAVHEFLWVWVAVALASVVPDLLPLRYFLFRPTAHCSESL
jgi:multidrug resistance protein MdtO